LHRGTVGVEAMGGDDQPPQGGAVIATHSPPAAGDAGPSTEGYVINSTGLANMVKDNQIQFLRAYGGGEELAKRLKCDPNKGQSKNADFAAAQAEYGRNYIDPPTVTPYLVLIWEGLHDVTLLMLIASAVVSIVLGLAVGHDESVGGGEESSEESSSAEWLEGVAILVTVALVLNVQAMTDWSKSRQFRKQQLELEDNKFVQVIRDGEDLTIHPRDLVVGDLMRIAVGDILPADAVMLHGSEIKMDESALTGESTLIPKCTAAKALAYISPEEAPADMHDGEKEFPFLLSGTSVMSGTAKVLVVAVGEHSLQGRILALATKENNGEIVAAMDHPDEAKGDKEEEATKPKNPVSKCCGAFMRGVRGFFTFGNLDAGGTLVEKLDQMAIDIGKAGVTVAVITFTVMVVRWCVIEFTGENARAWAGVSDVEVLLESFVTAVTILVVAIPEGLPLAVTLSLAISMRRMTRDNNQVKHMDSCETMGSATTICSDKTGTLTENRMTVMRAVLGGKTFLHDTASNQSVGAVIKADSAATKSVIELFCQAIALNSSSTSTVQLDSDGTTWKYTGNATECALLKLAAQLDFPASTFRSDKRFADPDGKLDWGVFTIPFSSSRKKMSWIVPKPDGGFRLFAKGAPSYIFDTCTRVASADGTSSTELSQQVRQDLNATVGAFQDEAMRTIALAYRDFDSVPDNGWDAKDPTSDSGSFLVEAELTLLGMVGIEDPLRPSVIQAIKQCNSAGVDVRMCTGDALATAIAISKQCGILRPRDLVDGRPKPNFAMTGAEFDERVHFLDESKPKLKRRVFDKASNDAGEGLAYPFLCDENGNRVLNQREFDVIWPKLRVLARCQPEDKLTLVNGLRNSKLFKDTATCAKLDQEHGIKIFPDYQVVAVTGDGTNDAPALRSADVGFAMGIVGTDIAKQACDIMLLDDNFASIVAAAKWGRNVYDSISKFVQFQLTINIVAITIAVIGSFAFGSSPLSTLQMLWVNMIMDSLASIALATEPPVDELLERPPYGKRRPIISRVMLFNMCGHALYQLTALLVILFADPSWMPGNVQKFPPSDESTPGDPTHWSILFNSFVQMQLFNQFNSRKLQTVERLKSTWGEWNVFIGATKNKVFVVVMVCEFLLQALIVQFAGAAFRLVPGGLSGAQWGVCLGFGVFSLVWQFPINAALVATDGYFIRREKMSRVAIASANALEASERDLEAAAGASEKADRVSPLGIHSPRTKARARWDLIRTDVTTTGKYKRSSLGDSVDSDDTWLARGQSRPFRDYVGSKEESIRMERQISETGREMLGLTPRSSVGCGSAQGSARSVGAGAVANGAGSSRSLAATKDPAAQDP